MSVRHSTINLIFVVVVTVSGAVAGGMWGVRRDAEAQSQSGEQDVISHLASTEAGGDVLVGVSACLGGILGLIMTAGPLTVLSAFQARDIWYNSDGRTRAALQSAMHDLQHPDPAVEGRQSHRPLRPYDSRDHIDPPA